MTVQKTKKLTALQEALSTPKDIDEQLLQQLMIFDKIAEISPGHIYWLDKDGQTIIGCNERQAKALGLNSRTEIIGKTIYELLPKSLADNIFSNNIKVSHEGKDCIFEEKAMFYEREVTYLSHKMPMRDSKGNIVGLIGTSIDITERKKIEVLEKEKQLMIEDRARFMSKLSGYIAHEMRIPLMTLSAYLDLIKENEITEYDNADRIRTLNKIVDDSKYIIQSANTCIDMLIVKLSSAHTKISKEDFQRRSIADDLATCLDQYPFAKNERRLIRWADDIDFQYLGDDTLTKHVLFNLIQNSLRAIKNAGKGKIYFEIKQDNTCNQLIVRDTAVGIQSDLVSKIFDSFEGKKFTASGSGLGLSFCKMVMENYGGNITCDSKEGDFAEFVLNFPKID